MPCVLTRLHELSMRDQTSYMSRTVAGDLENMSEENMLQDAKIISVILAFQKSRGLKPINSTVSTEILLAISFAHR